MARFFLRTVLVGLLLAGPAFAGPTLARLKADLLGKRSATEVLTQWCVDLKLASPAVIHAEKISGAGALSESRVRALLQAGPNAVVRHRRVRLVCGRHVMSEADNWYLPARLTAGMNRQLESSDTSFGTVVRPLNFHRQTLEAKSSAGSGAALEITALLITPKGAPFSLVVEDYAADLVKAR